MSSNPAGISLNHRNVGDLVKKVVEFLVAVNPPRSASGFFLLGGLNQLGDAEITKQEQEKKQKWSEIQKHPVFQKLLQDRSFKQALDSFRKQIKPNLMIEVGFIAIVAFYLMRYFLELEQPELIQQPNTKTRNQAGIAARKLQQLFRKGARLDNLQDQTQLETLLIRFISHIDKAPDERQRNDKTWAQRLFVKRLAKDFLSSFGKPLTSIVSSLAAIIGYEPDQRNIDNILKKARDEHEREQRQSKVNVLVNALRPTK